jgi:hypothetical protein
MRKEGGEAGDGGAMFHIRARFALALALDGEPIGGIAGIQIFPESSMKRSKKDASMPMVKQASLFNNRVMLLLVGDLWCWCGWSEDSEVLNKRASEHSCHVGVKFIHTYTGWPKRPAEVVENRGERSSTMQGFEGGGCC